ncbi:MAG: RelA/SpoT family protein [Patescibacteria group bacterium]|jgi:GTP pyrophosphokinase|nr:RelA/SpoT family protein [Patescibacteria group bacterium]
MITSKSSFLKFAKDKVDGLSGFEINLIDKAYDFAKVAHEGQLRASGKPYFTGHCVPVAVHIIELGMDSHMIVAALLHDTIEDTDITVDIIEKEFNKDVANLVGGVSKLGHLKYRGNERHVESLRKFFVSSAKDVRVVILKLADRWHNLETLKFLPADKQKRIALESIMIHAPLASRLGMGKLVNTINDLAFPYAYPEEFLKTKKLMDYKLKKAEGTIKKMYRDLLFDVSRELGYSPKIDKRIKGTYSLYRKLDRKNWNEDEIFDLVALRVITHSISDCYQALGAVHTHWKPVPGRVKDYIAVPKPNGYQSLHTAVFSGDGPIVEIQVRTEQMHEFNEYGIASHHSYKNRSLQRGINKETFAWIEQLREYQAADVSPNDYLKRLKTDFFQDRIFVFTPKGDVIDLPEGSTIIDFAYAVHSEIGSHAIGGKINGKYMALKSTLQSGDIVEIDTSPKAKPSDKWLEMSITSYAQNRIRKSVKKRSLLGLVRRQR